LLFPPMNINHMPRTKRIDLSRNSDNAWATFEVEDGRGPEFLNE
jgi:hypothetical protein